MAGTDAMSHISLCCVKMLTCTIYTKHAFGLPNKTMEWAFGGDLFVVEALGMGSRLQVDMFPGYDQQQCVFKFRFSGISAIQWHMFYQYFLLNYEMHD